MATESEVTANVAVVPPAPTVTVAGTVAAAVLELDSETTTPLEGAFPFRVTVPTELAEPPTTVAGARLTTESAGGLSVRFAVFVTPA